MRKKKPTTPLEVMLHEIQLTREGIEKLEAKGRDSESLRQLLTQQEAEMSRHTHASGGNP